MELKDILVLVHGFQNPNEPIVSKINIFESQFIHGVVWVLKQGRSNVNSSLRCEVVVRQIQLNHVVRPRLFDALG